MRTFQCPGGSGVSLPQDRLHALLPLGRVPEDTQTAEGPDKRHMTSRRHCQDYAKCYALWI